MARYTNLDNLFTKSGKPFKGTVRYPLISTSFSDIYVFTDSGDRYDILAQQYYGDPSLWWVIVSANPQLPKNSYYPPEGTQLRIPTNYAGTVRNFQLINN